MSSCAIKLVDDESDDHVFNGGTDTLLLLGCDVVTAFLIAPVVTVDFDFLCTLPRVAFLCVDSVSSRRILSKASRYPGHGRRDF